MVSRHHGEQISKTLSDQKPHNRSGRGLDNRSVPWTSDLVKKIYMGGDNPRLNSPTEVIQMVAKINKDECVACGACVDVCPEQAIT
jgi:NAD-dependent dihydropyrimidine dehydrogenase PreA subunit